MVTEEIEIELMTMLPVMFVQVARASRSLWLPMLKPAVLLQVLLPVWATPRRWLATISEDGRKRSCRRSMTVSSRRASWVEGEFVPCTRLKAAKMLTTIDDLNIVSCHGNSNKEVAWDGGGGVCGCGSARIWCVENSECKF